MKKDNNELGIVVLIVAILLVAIVMVLMVAVGAFDRIAVL
jgi:hypothetical protein